MLSPPSDPRRIIGARATIKDAWKVFARLKWVWVFGVSLFVLIGYVVGIFDFTRKFAPQIEIEPMTAIDRNDTFSTPFSIKNLSEFDITNVDALLYVVSGKTVKGLKTSGLGGGCESPHIERVAAHNGTNTIQCHSIKMDSPIDDADLRIVVNYTFLRSEHSETFMFRLKIGTDGAIWMHADRYVGHPDFIGHDSNLKR